MDSGESGRNETDRDQSHYDDNGHGVSNRGGNDHGRSGRGRDRGENGRGYGHGHVLYGGDLNDYGRLHHGNAHESGYDHDERGQRPTFRQG